jgi:nitrogenase molybdenum-iron protein alpha/beta subunit
LTGAVAAAVVLASVDSNYLTGKRVFIFADATHAIAAARIASEELGFKVVGLGTYPRVCPRCARGGREIRSRALITEDHLDVEDAIHRKRSRNWCWAPRWSATSPSGSGIPAP